MHRQNEQSRNQRVGLSPIRIDEVYALTDFKQRTGLGKDGLRAARRKGLRICRCGRNRYVCGSDWLRFLSSIEAEPLSGA